ncbi:MAG: hypothetical protein ACE5HQ_09585 [Gemmatimonadota bacterium]
MTIRQTYTAGTIAAAVCVLALPSAGHAQNKIRLKGDDLSQYVNAYEAVEAVDHGEHLRGCQFVTIDGVKRNAQGTTVLKGMPTSTLRLIEIVPFRSMGSADVERGGRCGDILVYRKQAQGEVAAGAGAGTALLNEELSGAERKVYLGSYLAGADTLKVTEKDETLFLVAPGADPVRLLAQGGDVFAIVENPGIRFRFEVTEGRATKLLFVTGDTVALEAARIP